MDLAGMQLCKVISQNWFFLYFLKKKFFIACLQSKASEALQTNLKHQQFTQFQVVIHHIVHFNSAAPKELILRYNNKR